MPHDGHDRAAAHPFQPDREDTPYTRFMVLAEAVGELLIEKNVITARQLRRKIEWQQGRKPEMGAKLVARAWLEPGYKKRLLADVNAAADEAGVDAGVIPIRAIENTPDVHNVVVCTLCSCYPRQLIGIPPDWYKSRAYRARAVKEPRAVLREFGVTIPDGKEVRVHDSTADLRYMVIPERPGGTDGFTEDRLAALVTRDSLVGAGLARDPEAPDND